MKEPYGEGLATHTGPESCGAAREGGIEALGNHDSYSDCASMGACWPHLRVTRNCT
jgi:hypothetical protein